MVFRRILRRPILSGMRETPVAIGRLLGVISARRWGRRSPHRQGKMATMGSNVLVITSPLSLARQLWFYGEDALWERALELSPEAVADIGERAGRLAMNPDGDRKTALVRAAIAHLEGSLRAPARMRRRPEKNLPARLIATEERRLSDPGLKAVSRVVQDRALRDRQH